MEKKRNVGNVSAIWPHEPNAPRDFLTHLNARHSYIKFSGDLDRISKYPFWLPWKTNARTTCRKPTHTDRYLQAASHQPLAHKRPVTDNTKTVCDKPNQTSKLQSVESVLQADHHSLQEINRASKTTATNKSNMEKVENKTT
jgi:hypothetical protein